METKTKMEEAWRDSKGKWKYRGNEQLKVIIKEIMDSQEMIKFQFLNGVLSCEEFLGKFQLWLHWGKLRIVPSKDRYKDGLTAGDCKVLEDWNTEEDGTFTLIGKKD